MKKEMDIYKFDELASNIYYKVYPLIAKQAIERTGINKGVCIDVGSGGGHLGIALAENTNMKVYLYDILKDSKSISDAKINGKKLEKRVSSITGDVHSMPFKNNSTDLVISRGSFGAWEDKVQAIKEIYRTLKPNGKTYIGGGYGSNEYQEEIEGEMISRKAKGWYKGKKKRNPKERKKEISEILKKADIYNFEMIDDESGYWIIVSKE